MSDGWAYEVPRHDCHRCEEAWRMSLPADAHPGLRLSGFMIVCPACGDKRCPRASDHRNLCTQRPEAP